MHDLMTCCSDPMTCCSDPMTCCSDLMTYYSWTDKHCPLGSLMSSCKDVAYLQGSKDVIKLLTSTVEFKATSLLQMHLHSLLHLHLALKIPITVTNANSTRVADAFNSCRGILTYSCRCICTNSCRFF